MKKFDIAYKFTVLGIKTVEDFSASEATNEFQQDLVDAIQIDLGDGSILLELQASVHPHNQSQVEFETADLLERKARGMFSASASAGIVPYSASQKFTPDVDYDEDKAKVEDSSLSETEVVLD